MAVSEFVRFFLVATSAVLRRDDRRDQVPVVREAIDIPLLSLMAFDTPNSLASNLHRLHEHQRCEEQQAEKADEIPFGLQSHVSANQIELGTIRIES